MKQRLHLIARYTGDFFKSKTGKGPKEIKPHLMEDKILIELYNYLTPIELEVITTPEGTNIIKQAREKFTNKYAEEFLKHINSILSPTTAKNSVVAWDIIRDTAYIIMTINS